MIRADERLQRLLMAFPLMADNPGMSVEELAHRVGTTTKVLTKDFASLERYDTPAGWVDTVQLLIQQGQASMQSSHFKRPQKLNRPEMLALDLGLGMLQSELPVDERAVVARTRQLLQAVTARRATSGSEGDRREDAIMAESARASQLAMLAVLQQAQEQQLVVALQYQRPDEVQPGVRRVRPYALVRADASIYLVAFCERNDALRVFRLDRVRAAVVTTDAFERPADFTVDSVLQQGHVFVQEAPAAESLVVRYSPTVARWIAERERGELHPDGSLLVHYPLADESWAIRHVLQYGPDAVILAPERVRHALALVLQRALDEVPA